MKEINQPFMHQCIMLASMSDDSKLKKYIFEQSPSFVISEELSVDIFPSKKSLSRMKYFASVQAHAYVTSLKAT